MLDSISVFLAVRGAGVEFQATISEIAGIVDFLTNFS